MEFGQRALGNRSILADPTIGNVKERLNAAVKNRDFWMPFVPIILDECVDRYLKNTKRIHSPYMTIGFETTEEGYQSMSAACHPADRNARAQILKENDNTKLYSLLKKFAEKTDRGAHLKTSFNLHGFPIVCSLKDALEVFANSKIDVLITNRKLILK